MESTLPTTKVRRILQIAHEAQEIADTQARLRHLLAGALLLVGADVGCLFVFDATRPHVPVVGILEGHGHRNPSTVLAQYAQGDNFDIMAQQIRATFARSGSVLARRRQELINDRDWYRSVYLNEFRRWWGFDHSIYSMLTHGTAHVGMSVNRSFGGGKFEPQDQDLIETFHLACARVATESLHRNVAQSNKMRRDALAPRARDTLDCLLRGASTKDVSDELGLSPNTVRHYTKAIFRAFDVRSRSELLAHWHSET